VDEVLNDVVAPLRVVVDDAEGLLPVLSVLDARHAAGHFGEAAERGGHQLPPRPCLEHRLPRLLEAVDVPHETGIVGEAVLELVVHGVPGIGLCHVAVLGREASVEHHLVVGVPLVPLDAVGRHVAQRLEAHDRRATVADCCGVAKAVKLRQLLGDGLPDALVVVALKGDEALRAGRFPQARVVKPNFGEGRLKQVF
jgi:hypothetical protein